MAANGALDFDDLLTRTTWLFQEQPEVLSRYQERYQYLLVDEFQDTNTAQYEMVRLLAKKSNNLFGVGDEDQCVVAGTPIMTPDGYQPVESLCAGDRITAAAGHGSAAQGRIDACPSHHYSGRVISVTTVGGRNVDGDT